MDIFFSDIDNTLIYSHNHILDVEKIVVEYLNDIEQSYMTKQTYEFLSEQNWLTFIPVTTRTEAQFRRLDFINEVHVKYAIICNGGKLLVNGKEESIWTDKTLEMTKNQIDDLEKAAESLKKLCQGFDLHRPESYMFYIKSDNPKSVFCEMSRRVNSDNVVLEYDRRKVYLFASNVNKGVAIKRFGDIKSIGKIFVAGDDRMDIPMLNRADIAFAGKRIYDDVCCSNKVLLKGDILSDQLCVKLKDIYKNGLI